MSQYTKTQFKFWDVSDGLDEQFLLSAAATYLLNSFFTINFLFWLIRTRWGMRPADNKIAVSDDPWGFLFWLFHYLCDLTCSGDNNSSLLPGKMKLNWAESELNWNKQSTYWVTFNSRVDKTLLSCQVMKTLQKTPRWQNSHIQIRSSGGLWNLESWPLVQGMNMNVWSTQLV